MVSTYGEQEKPDTPVCTHTILDQYNELHCRNALDNEYSCSKPHIKLYYSTAGNGSFIPVSRCMFLL